MRPLLDASSSRAQQARLGKRIGKNGFRLLSIIAAAALVGIPVLALTHNSRFAYLLAALGIACALPAIWWKKQLSILKVTGATLNDRLSVDTLARLRPNQVNTPKQVWKVLVGHWQTNFVIHHLLLPDVVIEEALSDDPASLQVALDTAVRLADRNKVQKIELGLIVSGLILTCEPLQRTLTSMRSQTADVESVANWMVRALDDENVDIKRYGGIGRDWAFGFTPLLNQYGSNISQSIMNHGAHFDWLSTSNGVLAIEAAFNNHTRAVAVIGADGIGKTSSIYALAQRLIEGKTGKTLAYHQIIGINATNIISSAHRQGELEDIMLRLASEASLAGHVIIFFDDAQLFMSDSAGSFDATQILLTIIKSSGVPIILALSPSDFQRLKSSNASLASLLTPVVLAEPSEADVMRVLEDSALGLEHRFGVMIAYTALHETYRLSGRYEQDEAYPGKAIKLLEQAVTHGNHGLVMPESVQAAIEQTRGVKAGNAAPAEAAALLNLEDQIHERMINQTHAVSVVSNALRRARAGVTNPRRPIGSFLFLGPTGVGKTELAKAVAATYFGSEASMIRLDMSEYQQPDDVQRLLATGQAENGSLLLSVRQQPFSVVLLDEIEKAHPNVLNLMLQMLDEGQLTDMSGRQASFKDCVIIATSNAGANTIRERIARGEELESFADALTDELIGSGQFKPELLNRFDDMVLFRPLNPPELAQVVRLMLKEVNQTLQNQNISVELTEAAIQVIVARGNDPRLGARPMRRALQKAVEDTVAKKILRGEARPGDTVQLDAADLNDGQQLPAAPQPPVAPPYA